MNVTMNLNDAPAEGIHKPVCEIELLIHAFSVNNPGLTVKKSEVLKYSATAEKNCIMLQRGSIAMRRRGDGMVVTSERAPFIFGLENQPGISDTMYLHCLEECDIRFISLEQANTIVATENLWKAFVHVLIYTTSRVFEHCTQVHHMSAYDIIRYQLYELLKESEEVRMSTTVAKYIKSRTYLSRSGIMRILSELKTGKYISIDNGILKGINYLPKKY